MKEGEGGEGRGGEGEGRGRVYSDLGILEFESFNKNFNRGCTRLC